MQTPVNSDVLGRSGIPDSLIPRTMQALLSLDLIDDQGNPTDLFEGLRLAPEAEYKQKMQEWLKGTYSEIFLYVDPSIDDEGKIRDAFRTYKPIGQQSRMVSLFTGRCSAAGLRPEINTDAKPRHTPAPRTNTPRKTTQKRNIENKNSTPNSGLQGVPLALSGLMQSLPQEGTGWTKDKRDKFYNTFGTVLDFCFPITEQGTESENDED